MVIQLRTMESSTCIVIALIVLISGCESEHVINQHTCDVEENTLVCDIKGQGTYEPDRRMAGVNVLVLKNYGDGTKISISKKYLPNLEDVHLDATTFGCDVAKTWKMGVRVFVNGEICIEQTTTKPTTNTYSTMMTDTEHTPINDRNEKTTVVWGGLYNVQIIVLVSGAFVAIYVGVKVVVIEERAHEGMNHRQRRNRRQLVDNNIPVLRRGARNRQPPRRYPE